MKRTNATGIFCKGDIQSPMQGVFNAPMLANGTGDSGTSGRQTAEVKVNLVGGAIPQVPSAFNDDNRLQPHPFLCLIQRGQLVERNGPHRALLNAVMRRFGRLFGRGG
jgi:hypothetical protein